jgi:hypothetical protein
MQCKKMVTNACNKSCLDFSVGHSLRTAGIDLYKEAILVYAVEYIVLTFVEKGYFANFPDEQLGILPEVHVTQDE